MNLNIIKKTSIFFLLFFGGINLMAQTTVAAYTDVGKNYVSDGVYLKTAGLAQYEFQKYKIATGFQLDVINNNENIFSGYDIKASRQFLIKKFSFETKAFFIYTPFSDILYETNWGLLLIFNSKHFKTRIGNNFRTYAYNKKANTDYNIDSNTKIHENWNMMYSLSYYIKPNDNWSVGLTATNFDFFLINQETNPVFNLQALYKINKPVYVFAESWYKTSGAFNLSVNYFGFLFRAGIVWKIN